MIVLQVRLDYRRVPVMRLTLSFSPLIPPFRSPLCALTIKCFFTSTYFATAIHLYFIWCAITPKVYWPFMSCPALASNNAASKIMTNTLYSRLIDICRLQTVCIPFGITSRFMLLNTANYNKLTCGISLLFKRWTLLILLPG